MNKVCFYLNVGLMTFIRMAHIQIEAFSSVADAA